MFTFRRDERSGKLLIEKSDKVIGAIEAMTGGYKIKLIVKWNDKETPMYLAARYPTEEDAKIKLNNIYDYLNERYEL
jgi:hypothetical protein